MENQIKRNSTVEATKDGVKYKGVVTQIKLTSDKPFIQILGMNGKSMKFDPKSVILIDEILIQGIYTQNSKVCAVRWSNGNTHDIEILTPSAIAMAEKFNEGFKRTFKGR